MDILNKLDLILNEANNKIPKGLLGWVADYIETRINGNTKLAKEIKQNIEDEIEALGLDKKEVFNYFGDPDKNKDKVMKNINKFRG